MEIRKSQAEFIARGLASLEQAGEPVSYYSTDDVLSMMQTRCCESRETEMTYQLRYTEEALADFDRIYDFLSIAYDIDAGRRRPFTP